MSVTEQECQCSCSDNLFKELEQFINKLKQDKKGNLKDRALLIEVLHKAQGLFGYLPPKVQTYIAEKLDVSPAKVFGVDTSQAQSLGFSQLLGGELLIAFVVLVVLTPLFEEALFRGFLYGRLRQTSLPWWVPAVIVSLLFGLAHGQWNVGIDVFVLSMVACGLREVTGSIWAGILLHMAKNMVAFFAVFVFTTGIAG